ncbi:MAG: hypothetical protein WA144_00560 [Candidatus Methanoperedens sp.]
METYFSKRTWIFLWICLIILNVVLRLPVTPHEIGHDSFILHYASDSISTYGHAKWWLHPLSIVSLYPFSMASALPFILSGVSQSLSLDMEYSIWLVSLILGILSAFTAYLMAGVINNDKLFKFITALVYSTFPGILTLTTWNASGRGLFLVLLPLFIYFIIKFRFSRIRYILLTVVLFTLILTTHNLFYLTIPIIMAVVIARMNSNIQIKSSNILGGFLLLIMFLVFFTQFSVRQFIIIDLFIIFARYIGVMGIFALGGFISLLFKNNKNFEETFLLLVLLFFTPTISYVEYSKYLLLPFEALIISYGLINVIRMSNKKKVALTIVMLCFVSSIGFAEFYQFGNTDTESPYQFAAEDSIVNAAHWTKLYTNKTIFSGDFTVSRRLLAYSGVSAFTEDNIVSVIQGNLVDFNVTKRSPTSILFYSEGPFHAEDLNGMNSYFWSKMKVEGYDAKWVDSYLKRYEIKYYFKDERSYNAFSKSVVNRTDKLFDIGKFSVWDL